VRVLGAILLALSMIALGAGVAYLIVREVEVEMVCVPKLSHEAQWLYCKSVQ
jgi:hypothetical protein